MLSKRRYQAKDIPFIMKGEQYFEELYYKGISFTKEFFENNLLNQNYLIDIFLYKNKLAGYCIIEKKEIINEENKKQLVGEIEFYIDKKFRGKHIAKTLIPYSIKDFFLINKDINLIYAYILKINYGSLNVCKSIGFKYLKDFIEIKNNKEFISNELYIKREDLL